MPARDNPITSHPSLTEIKRRHLERRRADLLEEYEAASRQLSHTLGEVERTRLSRQLEDLEEQIAAVEESLGGLAGADAAGAAAGAAAGTPAGAATAATGAGAGAGTTAHRTSPAGGPPAYVDFQVLVAPDQAIRASSELAGEAQGTVVLDLAALQQELAALEENPDPGAAQLKGWGDQLYAALFPPAIHAHLRATVAVAGATGRSVRLRLVLEPPALASLPWELLYDAESNLFLATAGQMALSRYLPVATGLRSLLATSLPLPALLVLVSPRDLPALDLDAEEHLIRQALARYTAAGLVRLDVLRNPTPRGLHRALLAASYSLVHFSGHGDFRDGEGSVFLDAGDGSARAVDEERFANVFLESPQVGLVVLNACQSGTTGAQRAFAGMAPHLVRRGLPAVVAMQFAVGDATARVFAEEFYNALALGWPVDAAMQATRNAIALEAGLARPDFATPVLFMRTREGLTLVDPATLPPWVEATAPADGATGVDPGLIQVSITFDRAMDQHSWSIDFDPAFPLRTHRPAWSADGRTATFTRDTAEALPPGAALAFTVNPSGRPGPDFVDLEGRRALPRTFRFTTGAGP